MVTASLVLQYPDWQSGKIRLLATTKNPKALKAFKDAVLEEARLILCLPMILFSRLSTAKNCTNWLGF